MQTTLRNSASVSGIGVHSGRAVSITVLPAAAGTGIWFHRTDVNGGRDPRIQASFRNVSATDFCTAVGTPDVSVATVEHLMAALRALDVDNAKVEIDGAEVPVMDGSAGPFLEALEDAGVESLDTPRKFIKVLRPVSIAVNGSRAEFTPHSRMRIEVEIDFENPIVGRQHFAADVDAEMFRREIARARTFGFLADVEALWSRGLALGASLENAIVVGEDRILNSEGLRFADEFVRHKALDAVGDLALAGAPILGCYRSYRGGHRLNVKAVEALMADETAWAFVEMPAWREIVHADLPVAVAGVAYGPDAA